MRSPAATGRKDYCHAPTYQEDAPLSHWAPPQGEDSRTSFPETDSCGHCPARADHAPAAAVHPGSYYALFAPLPPSSACTVWQADNWEPCQSCLGSQRCSVCQVDGNLSSCPPARGVPTVTRHPTGWPATIRPHLAAVAAARTAMMAAHAQITRERARAPGAPQARMRWAIELASSARGTGVSRVMVAAAAARAFTAPPASTWGKRVLQSR